MSSETTHGERPFHAGGEVAFLVLALSLGSSACGGSSTRPRAVPARVDEQPVVEVLELDAFGGAEVCFNGLDDNGNLLIDEGCGVAQSEVQFVLAWTDPSADLDLYVSDPDDHLAVADGTTSLGLTLSADCPEDRKNCHGQNFENAYLEQPDPAPGTYRVRIRVEKIPVAIDRIEATLGVRTPKGTMAHQIVFFSEGQEAFLEFDVPETAPQKKRTGAGEDRPGRDE